MITSQSREAPMSFKAVALQFAVIVSCLIPGVLGASAASAQERTVKLVGFGDSLMAGYQLAPEEALPPRLQAALKAKGFNVTIENAGVSGDTTAGGLARVDWSVPDGTDGVILELGANDVLRGLAPAETEKNLEAIIKRLQERGIAVMLVGMLTPPNMGSEFSARFNDIYPRLAEKYQLPLHPFVLDGVVTQQDLQLEDGMHPNAKGVSVMAERMLPVAERFVTAILEDAK